MKMKIKKTYERVKEARKFHPLRAAVPRSANTQISEQVLCKFIAAVYAKGAQKTGCSKRRPPAVRIPV